MAHSEHVFAPVCLNSGQLSVNSALTRDSSSLSFRLSFHEVYTIGTYMSHLPSKQQPNNLK